MEHFDYLNRAKVSNYLSENSHGIKFGKGIKLLSNIDQLNQYDSDFVMFGIPDGLNDLSNFEKFENMTSFHHTLKELVNIQDNLYNHPQNLIILGEINPDHFYKKAKSLDTTSESYTTLLQSIYSEINHFVAELVSAIVESQKIPIIIGGNHIYSHGIVKGTSRALGSPINILNISPTSYFKQNSNFSSTDVKENLNDFINRLNVFGLHKNYTSQIIYDRITTDKHAKLHFFEDSLHLTTLDKSVQLKNALDFLKNKFGLELNLESIDGMNFHSEAFLAFSVRDIRTFIKIIRKERVDYVHFSINETDQNKRLGKSLSYLISDFLRYDS